MYVELRHLRVALRKRNAISLVSMFTLDTEVRKNAESVVANQGLTRMISVEQPESPCHEAHQIDMLYSYIAGMLSYRTSIHKLKSALRVTLSHL